MSTEQKSPALLEAAVSRRQFLAGFGALTLAVSFSGPMAIASELGDKSALTFKPNAFIRVDKDGMVTVISSYLEMGQGTFTGLATLAAEELDINPSQLRVEAAPADVKLYMNPILASWGDKVQGTGGSTAMAGAWQQMRTAAATARQMLLEAAAQTWGVPASTLSVKDGVISQAGSGKSAGYSDFVAKASTLPLPAASAVKLKDSAAFTKIGVRGAMPRVDIPAKVNGSAIYTQDIQLPGMLVAVIAHPPRLFAKALKVDASKAKAVPGVVAVLEIPGDSTIQGGVAVLAKNTWVAKKGRDALEITWDPNTGLNWDSDTLFTRYRELGATKGTTVINRGQQPEAVPEGGQELKAVFELPYLAHAPMEPMNTVVQITEGHCQIWNGEQWQTGNQASVAKELGLTPGDVEITQLYAGGSFGRRGNLHSDYVLEAARITKVAYAQNIKVPIKMVWMREDDMRGVGYRPMTVHDTRLVLDKAGNISAWRWRIVGQSFSNKPTTEVDELLIEGSADMPYAIANLQVEQHIPDFVGIPTSWLRAVGHTHTGVVEELLVSQAAAMAGKDPYQYRRAMLKDKPRYLAVLDRVAKDAGWDMPLPGGNNGQQRARGIAIHQAFGTIVAQVAEVSVATDGSYSVDKVYCVVDCGHAINPSIIEAQAQGSVAFGLSFLRQEITLAKGQVVQGNFNTYPVLRINAMPQTQVSIIDSSLAPTGMGEPAVPPIVPAVLDALASITKQYPTRLPVGDYVTR